MDQPKYSTLMEALQDLPDPRKARGKRFEWCFLLGLIASALASGQQTGSEIGDWVALHASELIEQLKPRRGQVASGSTLRRVLQGLDIALLERHVAQYIHDVTLGSTPHPSSPTPTGEGLRGQAVDGKKVRGVTAHGQSLHLVSLVEHGSGRTLAQTAVDKKSNEIRAAPDLLRGRDLTGTVTTMDAMLTQRDLAQQILDQHGHYFMVVKGNQPELQAAIATLFEHPIWLAHEKASEYDDTTEVGKGHGRLERRTLESSTTLNDYLPWPSVGQVMRRCCRRQVLKTGKTSQEITYAITDLRPQQADAACLAALWRGHWTIENRVHYVRDVTFGEDACQIHVGTAPRALAILRNALLTLLRCQGWTNLAQAVRSYGASVPRALDLIGALPH